jgi:hypothetical protein
MALGRNGALQIRNPFVDGIQTVHSILLSGVFLNGIKSSYTDQRGPAHKGSICQHVRFLLLFSSIPFCALIFSVPSKNGSADFDDPYVERRGLMQEVAFDDPNASENFKRVYFR